MLGRNQRCRGKKRLHVVILSVDTVGCGRQCSGQAGPEQNIEAGLICGAGRAVAVGLIYGRPSAIKLHASLIENQRAKKGVLQITPSSPYMSILCDWSEIIGRVQDQAAALIGQAGPVGSLPDPASGMLADSPADTRQINHMPAFAGWLTCPTLLCFCSLVQDLDAHLAGSCSHPSPPPRPHPTPGQAPTSSSLTPLY